MERCPNGNLIIHSSFIAENAAGHILDVICTFRNDDKLFGKDLKDSNGKYCLFDGLVAAKCIPVFVDENQQKVSCIASIPFDELHLGSSVKLFGKEWARSLSCRVNVVDVQDEETILGEAKLSILYGNISSEDKK